MAAELSLYFAALLTVDGVPQPDVGTLRRTVKGEPVAIDDGARWQLQPYTIPAGEAVVVWQWGGTQGFTYLAILPRPVSGSTTGLAEGLIQVGARYNPTTDGETDLTPVSGTNHWKEVTKSCVGVFELDSERAYIHATAATEIGETVTGALNGGVGKYPKVWDQSDKVLAACDAVAVYNQGDDPVNILLFVAGK